MKFIGAVRGDGVLRTPDGEAAVSYQIDTFEERSRTTVSGSLVGDIGFALDQAAGKLTLASGEVIDIVLVKPDDEGADFQAA